MLAKGLLYIVAGAALVGLYVYALLTIPFKASILPFSTFNLLVYPALIGVILLVLGWYEIRSPSIT